MINCKDHNKYRFFLEREVSCLSQLVAVLRDYADVFSEGVRGVRVDQSDPVLQYLTRLRKIAPVESAYDSTAAESVGKFSVES